MSEAAANDGAPPSGLDRRITDAATWRRLLSAPDPKAFSSAWLTLLCAQIDLALAASLGGEQAVRQGMVALGSPDTRKFSRVAWLGAERDISLLLAKAGERAIQVRHGVVQVEDKPGGMCQIAHPILIGDDLYGVVALELPSKAKPDLDVAMRFAQWGVVWFAHLFAPRTASVAGQNDAGLRLEALTIALSASRHQPAAEACATFLADKLEADKVSIGCHSRGRTRLIALSHGGFAKIKNTYLTALTAAMDETADLDDGVHYPVTAGELAKPHAAHASLAREHGAEWVQSTVVDLDPDGDQQLVLLAEGQGDGPARIDEILKHVAGDLAPLLFVRFAAERGSLGRFYDVARTAVESRPSWRRIGIGAAAVAALAALFIPLPYRISADATLETTERRTIAAPFDGYLAEATVRPGDWVKAGAILARFDDRDLRNQRNDVVQRLSEVSRELNEAVGMLDRAKANVLAARKGQIEADLSLVDDQLSRAAMRAPFDAMIVAGDKTQSIGSPMRRGEPLYELSPLGSYRIALDVTQNDFADIAPGQEGKLVLSAMPFDSLALRVTRLTPIATAHDGKTVLRAEADLLHAAALMRPGMQGVAHIKVGTARLGWLLTHRIVDWIRLKLWSWMP